MKKLKLCLATICVIFNLIGCFVATYSWFVNAKQDKASSFSIQIEANELKLNYTLYKYNEEIKSVEETDLFNLSKYDSIIKERNTHTAIIAKIELNSNLFEEGFSNELIFEAGCIDQESMSYSLSNIIQFKNIIAEDISDANVMYNTILNLSENEEKVNFVDTAKQTLISRNISFTVDSTNKIILYSIINYDEELIDAMNIDVYNVPEFTNDLTFMRYSIHE